MDVQSNSFLFCVLTVSKKKKKGAEKADLI